MDLSAFAREVGPSGPVVPVGGRTQWDTGGLPGPDAREVRAPSGVVAHEPAEMIVRVRCGTTVAELDRVLATGRQMVPLDPRAPERATVGGVLSVGHSGVRRLRYGPVRDVVLEATFVSAAGTVVRAGAPVVKNVTGYDLCRLLVGSLGTLGVLAEVVLRTVPLPEVAQWYRTDAGPFDVLACLFRPASILWDGMQVWVLLEGAAVDVGAQARAIPGDVSAVDAPPSLDALPYRRSMRPAALRSLDAAGPFLAEIGVGTVHVATAPERAPVPREDLHRRVKAVFDPLGRLNPGRQPW